MELYEFLTTTTGGKCLFTMLVSMLPIIELRGGVPFGMAVLAALPWVCPPGWPFRRRWWGI